MASYVVKVQNKGTIRRLTLGAGELGFEKFQRRVRELFQLSAGQFTLTYVDKDGDVVTMAEDEDLKDALVVQALNPLRVTVENSREGGIDDGVKTSSPIALRTEANSGDVITEQQQSSKGEEIPPQSEFDSGLDSFWADAVAPEEPFSEAIPMLSGFDSFFADAVAPAEPVGEVIPPQSGFDSYFADAVAPAEPVSEAIPPQSEFDSFSADAIAPAEPASDSGKNSSLAEEKASPTDGARDSNPAGASPATPGAVEDEKKIPQGENKPVEDKSTRVLHYGVQCDICRMLPIAGPRFISATRHNYDLCRGCFDKCSNPSEYRRLDRPFVRHTCPVAFTPIHRLVSARIRQSPLCSRWIMVPNQIFPFFGILPARAAKERTPAVASGNGVKVGGRPVDISQAKSAATEGTSTAKPVEHVDADATTTSGSKQELGTPAEQGEDSNARTNVVEIPVMFSTEEANTQTPAGQEDVPSTEIETGSISGETGETAGVEEEDAQSPVAEEGESSTNEEDLVAKLATMGFEDSKLNAELLVTNNFDLRKTVDDLCAAAEWDPILGELQEMGFYDANMNRRLLFKNNGSVKHVVKELVQMYKQKVA